MKGEAYGRDIAFPFFNVLLPPPPPQLVEGLKFIYLIFIYYPSMSCRYQKHESSKPVSSSSHLTPLGNLVALAFFLRSLLLYSAVSHTCVESTVGYKYGKNGNTCVDLHPHIPDIQKNGKNNFDKVTLRPLDDEKDLEIVEKNYDMFAAFDR